MFQEDKFVTLSGDRKWNYNFRKQGPRAKLVVCAAINVHSRIRWDFVFDRFHIIALALVLPARFLRICSKKHAWRFFAVVVTHCFLRCSHAPLLIFISCLQWLVVLTSSLLWWTFRQPLQTTAHTLLCYQNKVPLRTVSIILSCDFSVSSHHHHHHLFVPRWTKAGVFIDFVKHAIHIHSLDFASITAVACCNLRFFIRAKDSLAKNAQCLHT